MAQAQLANAYFSGTGTEQNHAEAAKYSLLAAEQGLNAGQNQIGYQYEHGLGVPMDLAEAASWYRRAADQGQPNAMHNLALLILSDQTVEQDPAMAYAWLDLAIRHYSVRAGPQSDIAIRLVEMPVPARLQNALRQRDQLGSQIPVAALLRAIAFVSDWQTTHGGPVAQESEAFPFGIEPRQGTQTTRLRLAAAHLSGDGVAQDLESARELLGPLSEEGVGPAQFLYGRMLINGQGGAVDLEEGVKLLQLAAERGSVNASALLGDLYRNGRGVGQDVSKAAEYYLTAADHGLAAAQFLLAALYAEGNGVTEDQEIAVTWYRRAADQGYPLAMHNLAAAYLRGNGIEQNRTMAYAWFQLVLQLYPEDSPNRETAQNVYDQLVARLPQPERDEADSFATGWEPKPE